MSKLNLVLIFNLTFGNEDPDESALFVFRSTSSESGSAKKIFNRCDGGNFVSDQLEHISRLL